MLETLLALNIRLSDRWSELWPTNASNEGLDYVEGVSRALKPRIRITDVGAGRNTPFADHVDASSTLVGVDLIAEDLRANSALDERVIADVGSSGLPPEAAGSEVVCSHFVLEHLPDINAFARETFRVLNPGGTTVHLFSGRWSLFAMMNRGLSERLAHSVLFSLRPESREVGGFKTYYDSTDPRSARQAFSDAGFSNVRTVLSWEVSQYMRWCFPLFVLSRIWEETAARLRLELFASYVLLTAEKAA